MTDPKPNAVIVDGGDGVTRIHKHAYFVARAIHLESGAEGDFRWVSARGAARFVSSRLNPCMTLAHIPA